MGPVSSLRDMMATPYDREMRTRERSMGREASLTASIRRVMVVHEAWQMGHPKEACLELNTWKKEPNTHLRERDPLRRRDHRFLRAAIYNEHS